MTTVLLWRNGFESDGMTGILDDRPRSGRPKRISAEQEAAIKFSNDPQFARKVPDIVGLYVNPPDRAIVLSVDEKSQNARPFQWVASASRIIRRVKQV